MALLGWWLYVSRISVKVSRDNSKEEEKRKWHSVLMNLLISEQTIDDGGNICGFIG